MNILIDTFLATGAFSAALYCLTLSRRLQRFTALESGMGGAIAVLSAQVDEMTAALNRAQQAADTSKVTLNEQLARSEEAAARLEILIASLHGISDPDLFDDHTEAPKSRLTRRRADRIIVRAAE